MIKVKEFKTLEEELLLLKGNAEERALTLQEILTMLSGKGRSLILMLLSLPFCQPIQIPGLSTPFGLAIAFFGLRIGFGKKIWLPKWLLKKSVPQATLKMMTAKTLHLIEKMKPWIHPRLSWLSRSSLMERANGLIIFVLGILLALPLPIPLSNLTAAWSIFFIALGILEDDGLFVLIGYLISLVTIALFLLVLFTVKNVIL